MQFSVLQMPPTAVKHSLSNQQHTITIQMHKQKILLHHFLNTKKTQPKQFCKKTIKQNWKESLCKFNAFTSVQAVNEHFHLQ